MANSVPNTIQDVDMPDACVQEITQQNAASSAENPQVLTILHSDDITVSTKIDPTQAHSNTSQSQKVSTLEVQQAQASIADECPPSRAGVVAASHSQKRIFDTLHENPQTSLVSQPPTKKSRIATQAPQTSQPKLLQSIRPSYIPPQVITAERVTSAPKESTYVPNSDEEVAVEIPKTSYSEMQYQLLADNSPNSHDCAFTMLKKNLCQLSDTHCMFLADMPGIKLASLSLLLVI